MATASLREMPYGAVCRCTDARARRDGPGVNPRRTLRKTLYRRRAPVHRLEPMAAVTDIDAVTDPGSAVAQRPAEVPVPHHRGIGLVPSASMITGGAIASVWFWIPLAILIIGISSIPSVIGFALAGVVFIYLMRGVDHVERVRSEAVFGMGIGIPSRRLSPHTGFQRWAHQLWLDVSSARFWKSVAHHYLRMVYDLLVTGLALTLLVFAFLAPAAAIAIGNSDADAGLSFVPTPVALAAGRGGGGRRRRVAGVRTGARRDDRPLAAVPVADRRAAVPGQRSRRRAAGRGDLRADRTAPHRARSARQRAAPAGVAGDDDRAGPDQARHRPARREVADRRGARRRQERAGGVAQRGARHRTDHPVRPRPGRRAVVGGAACE